MKRVIVIGLDGLEPSIAEELLGRGDLPNLKRICQEGGYSRLRTTYPAQTPVAWSTFTTGTNPGGHGIFDFLSRDPKTYLPVLALNKYEQKNAFTPPRVVNLRRGVPLWELLTQAGIASTVIRCPCAYPPDPIKGRMLSGVGVPDLRGGLGTSTFYTNRPGVTAEHSEKVVFVQVDGQNLVHTHLVGPRSPKSSADLTLPLQIQVDRPGGKATIRSEGQPGALEVQAGQWSDWLKVRFKSGMLTQVRGIVRFFLRQLEPEFQLYASPVNFDPEAPLFPITHPESYAAELQARLSTFYTSGMPEDHDGLNHGRFDETAYLDQCDLVLRERRRMMLSELDRFEEGFFFTLFDTPDRLQHMFWRFREPDHPANRDNDPQAAAAYREVIADHYRTLDGIVGKAAKYVDDQTLFVVLSDHGMNSFQRGLNLNTWLYENGFLALKSGCRPGVEENGDFFHNVDWGRTKAYALGLGCVYLNLKGRESSGVVAPDDAGGVAADLVKGLTGLVDPERGQTAVRSVLTRQQLYHGPYAPESPDLLVNFSPGYRVSWGTPLGGVPAGLFEDNVKRWSGDHVIDPALAPGVLFMNRPFTDENPGLEDLAPTILGALGVPKGAAMEGGNLLS